MLVLTAFDQKVGLPKVQQDHLAPVTPTIDSVQNTVGDDRTVAPSCEVPVFPPGLG